MPKRENEQPPEQHQMKRPIVQSGMFSSKSLLFGAGRGGRTPTRLPSADFETVSAANKGLPPLLLATT
jgi:hypothetical protein